MKFTWRMTFLGWLLWKAAPLVRLGPRCLRGWVQQVVRRRTSVHIAHRGKWIWLSTQANCPSPPRWRP